MSTCTPGDGTNFNNDGDIPKIPGVSGPDGPGVDYEITLKDGICIDANPIVIDTGAGEYVKFSAKETKDAANYYLDNVDVAIVDGAQGKVKLTITGADLPFAGIWWAAFIIYNSSDEPINEIRVWLYVEKGIRHGIAENTPLSIAEVRLFLMDKCPEDNFLLDDVEFSDTEYMAAIRWPVDKWNETPPDVRRFTQTTFPWRYHWMVGAGSMLLRTAAFNYARNELKYSAGGLSVADKTKDQQYRSMSQELQAEYLAWMQAKKIAINQELAFGGIGSWQFDGSTFRGTY